MARRLRRFLTLGLCALAGIADAVELRPVVSGLSSPVYVTSARDRSGRLFIVEQGGLIHVLGPSAADPTPFLDLRDRVLSGGERGLLGLAFHPRYPSNGRFFVNYTTVARPGLPAGTSVIAEYRVSANPDVASTDERIVLTISRPRANHNAGMIEFGPDGFLYIGTGDSGGSNDPDSLAQNPAALQGKMLRIDIDGPAPYAIPPDNPFVASSAAAARPEIWALGLRNPYRFSFDRLTGRLVVGDVGQDHFEEIDSVTTGANFGWPVFEGSECNPLGQPALCGSPGYTPPIAVYARAGGRCSVIGGYAYRGPGGALPQGAYVFGDFCSGEIFTLDARGMTLLLQTALPISSFGEDEVGELYVVTLNGGVLRLVGPAGAPSLVAAVLPSSRSVMVGTPATAFATIINTSTVAATGCRLALVTPLPATLNFQTTDPATNRVTGVIDTPVTIAPGGSQSFVFAITPSAPIPPTDVEIGFQCDGSTAPVFPGVNTLQFSADAGAVPDLVALTALPDQSGGVLNLDPVTGAGAFGVASVNVGVFGRMTVTPDSGPGGFLARTLAICQIDALARCLSPPQQSVAVDVPANATPSFAVFVSGFNVPFDPANKRIYVRFRDDFGAVRGATSVSARTR